MFSNAQILLRRGQPTRILYGKKLFFQTANQPFCLKEMPKEGKEEKYSNKVFFQTNQLASQPAK